MDRKRKNKSRHVSYLASADVTIFSQFFGSVV